MDFGRIWKIRVRERERDCLENSKERERGNLQIVKVFESENFFFIIHGVEIFFFLSPSYLKRSLLKSSQNSLMNHSIIKMNRNPSVEK